MLKEKKPLDLICATLAERGSRYGEFCRHASITQELKRTVFGSCSSNHFSDSQREALEMILHKIGRIVNGDPNYDDSWRDIAGYAELVVRELTSAGERVLGNINAKPDKS